MSSSHRMHVALNVADLDASRSFYEDLFGVSPDKVKPGFVRFQLDDPALALSLNTEGPVTHGNSVAHLGIRLGAADDLSAARSRLEGAGHALKIEDQVHCCHAVQDKFWVKDPDGNEWEYYVLTDDDPAADAGNGCCS